MDLAWKDGRAVSATLRAAIRSAGQSLPVKTAADATVSVELKAGQTYDVTFR